MKLAYLSFTEKGTQLANKIAESFGGTVERCNVNYSLSGWTEKYFHEADGLIFVGAAGIAVRAIAPFLKSKVTDPAVIVVDECGKYAIPILAGHLGGGNDLVRKIGTVCGASPVITTATDINGVFAVDEWAKRQNCHLDHIHKIKTVSGKLLAGKEIRIRSEWEITGEPPEHVIFVDDEIYDVCLSISPKKEDALHLIPKIAVLGIGCRKGTPMENIEETFGAFLEQTDIHEKSICMVASIDLKKEETVLLKFCENHGFPFVTYTVEELQQAEGNFTPSAFVKSITGVDNVCERSAVLGGGVLYQKKFVGNGVTMALALRPFQPNWRWQDE